MNVCQIRIKAGKNYVFLSLSLSIYISFVPPNVFHELFWRRDQSKVKFPL